MWNQHSRFPRTVVATIFTMILAVAAFSGLSARTQEKSTAPAATREGKPMTEETPFYCNLNALSKAERDRYKQLTQKLVGASVETKELPDGYAFRLQEEMVSLSDLAEWTSYERRCCPFFDFEIELRRERGPLWLKLRGREGVKQFMRSEFGIG